MLQTCLGSARYSQLLLAKNQLLMPPVRKPQAGVKLAFERGQYAGKRCFIIGNGPSINELDLSALNAEHCMAVNRGYLLREKGLSHVTFYGLSDVNASAEYGCLIPRSFAQHFIAIGHGDYGDPAPSPLSRLALATSKRPSAWMSRGHFQRDITLPLAHSYTVVLHMLQVAVYAGFTEIYFIGVDNDFSAENMHFYADSAAEKRNMARWHIQPEADTDAAFAAASNQLSASGVRLYNAGVGGKLNGLARVEFASLF